MNPKLMFLYHQYVLVSGAFMEPASIKNVLFGEHFFPNDFQENHVSPVTHFLQDRQVKTSYSYIKVDLILRNDTINIQYKSRESAVDASL